MNSTLWAIPGFLGQPTDWDFLPWEGFIGFDYQSIQWNSLQDWAKSFNQLVQQHQLEPGILMGYSLGGRLALHALIDHPGLWRGAIIISAHPGLSEQQERDKRLIHDQQWAERFSKEEWQPLMKAWNNQEVFSQEDYHFERGENDYQRNQLVHALLTGSLALQKDLREPISGLNLPILWITGSRDQKYTKLAETVRLKHPMSRKLIIPEAGHRTPWGQPRLFANHVQAFLSDLRQDILESK